MVEMPHGAGSSFQTSTDGILLCRNEHVKMQCSAAFWVYLSRLCDASRHSTACHLGDVSVAHQDVRDRLS